MNICATLAIIISITGIKPSSELLIVQVTTQISKPALSDMPNITIPIMSTDKINPNPNLNFNSRTNSRQRYNDNPRNKKRSINTNNKMDRTIIGAIVIGSIFLFITLSITITVVIFCLKKNTVFVFQKSEQEDINDCTYDDCVDSVSCQSSLHYFDRPCSAHNSFKVGCRNHYSRPYVNEFLERCPVELFYPMHYDKPCPTQISQFKRHSQRKCHCHQVRHNLQHEQCTSKEPSNHIIHEPALWAKLNEESQYRPLFTTNTPSSFGTAGISDNVKITLDFIANRRVVTTVNQMEKTNVDDKPLLQEFSPPLDDHEGDNHTKLVLTPLGKSQTYTDLNHPQVDILQPVGNSQKRSSTKLTKSVSNYDAKLNNNRRY